MESETIVEPICETVKAEDVKVESEEKSAAELKLDQLKDRDEFAYLKNAGFSSEVYKIEIKNLPKYYGYGEIKKLINTTLNLECNKIKIPYKNSPFGFICFKNDDGMFNINQSRRAIN